MKRNKFMSMVAIFSAAVVLLLTTACTSEIPKNEEAQATVAEVTMENQAVSLEGVVNARQLGGYIGADGRRVKDNLLFRSGELSKLTDEGVKSLKDTYNIKTIVDFRTESEKQLVPEKQIDGIDNVAISVMDFNINSKVNKTGEIDKVQLVIDYAKSGMAESMYTDILLNDMGQKGYAKFFDILLNNEDGAVLWHCSQGKDRAGFAAALVLYALGVDDATILKDFELSNEAYKSNIDYMRKEAEARGCDEQTIKSVEYLTGVNPKYYLDAIEAVKNKYGSIHDYLNNQLGVSDEDIENLRNKYLE